MIHIKGKIPLSIHPLFWVTAVLIGFLSSGNVIGTLVWVFVVLISVLVHEFGHALTAKAFGLSPRIELVALGGMTYHQGDRLSFGKQFLIVFNGPLFGFLLFLASYFCLKLFPAAADTPLSKGSLFSSVLTLFYWVNLVWTILNLIPVMPLDGGQLLRIVLEAFFGPKGFAYSLIVGICIAGALSLFFFLFQHFLMGALFFLFAFQSFDLLRRARHLTQKDKDTHLKEALETAEQDLKSGQKDKALFAFERIRNESKEGMIYMTATQYLAFLKYELGRYQETYELLNSIRRDLSSEALCLLHQTAFEQKDFALVEEIGGSCYQILPSKEVALRNAFASAALAKAKPAVGWLETAFQEGLENISEIIEHKQFDSIRESTYFKQFLKHHS